MGSLASVFFASSVSPLWSERFPALKRERRCLKTPRSKFCRDGLNIARVFFAVRGSRQLLVIALRCVGRGRLVLRLVVCFLGSRQLLVIALHCVGRVGWFSGWLHVFLVVDSFWLLRYIVWGVVAGSQAGCVFSW